MKEPMNKSELLEFIQSSRERLEVTLAEVSQDQMTLPGAQDAWSVKDILAHIAVWEKRMVGWLEASVEGEAPQMLPAGMTWDDLDEWNEQIYLENRDRLLADVLAEFNDSYQRALRTVRGVPKDDLMEPHRFAWREEGRPLWIMVAANTFWHYDDHNDAIRTWLRQQA